MAIPQPRIIPMVNKAKPIDSLDQELHDWKTFLMYVFCSLKMVVHKKSIPTRFPSIEFFFEELISRHGGSSRGDTRQDRTGREGTHAEGGMVPQQIIKTSKACDGH
jgi:hypothetical protein